MGEYATIKATGERVKIGTCEDMLYLRADQAHLMRAEAGNVDPVHDTKHIRFRFPFPDEDGIEPGHFDNPRTLKVYGARAPEDVEHGLTQFRHDNGYLTLLPCPESDAYTEGAGGSYSRKLIAEPTIGIALNGYCGAVAIEGQRVWGSRLILVGECKGCGAPFRYETLAEVQSIIDGLASEAQRKRDDYERSLYRRGEHPTTGDLALAQQYNEIIRRIVDGYTSGAAPRIGLQGVRTTPDA